MFQLGDGVSTAASRAGGSFKGRVELNKGPITGWEADLLEVWPWCCGMVTCRGIRSACREHGLDAWWTPVPWAP